MKLSFFPALSVVLIAVTILSPVASASPAFGVKAGLNLANMKFSDEGISISAKTRPGLAVGANVEASLTPTNKITLRTDVMYMMKGTKEEYSNLGYSYKNTWKVDEIVIAPFAVFRFPSGKVTPFIQAGPELGINVTKKVTEEETYQGVTQSATQDLENWSSVNFGINLGGGIAVPAGKGEVLFDARYNLGLKNMYTGSGSGTIKTNGIQLLAGYNFSVPTK